ncbi:MAG: YqcI/YcgG family protein [Bacteroidetes bacterium]|nr:YqcI/YcgG family protein [Bacteroidota bacterium]
MMIETQEIPTLTEPTNKFYINEFKSFLETKEFPCVAARAALNKEQIKFHVSGHMACPQDNHNILKFLYDFIDEYRAAETQFHSAVVIFKKPEDITEEMFDKMLWMKLQMLSNMDSKIFNYDKRVSADPSSPEFSYSIKEEAFFVIGLNPASSRLARRFKYPALVFNPHSQFEKMRADKRYAKMKNIVRKRDVEFSGSINPMLEDFGEQSEVYQYSGKQYNSDWKCPFNINKVPSKN